MRGLIVYGAPATGKSTLTSELRRLEPRRFVPFSPVKCGPGRTEGYRMVEPDELNTIRAAPDDVVWEQRRYESTYVVLRSDLLNHNRGEVPMVELGQPAAVDAVISGTPEVRWHVVELRCARATVAARVSARGTGDDTERMAHYDTTPPLSSADLVVDTGSVAPTVAARMVARSMGYG